MGTEVDPITSGNAQPQRAARQSPGARPSGQGILDGQTVAPAFRPACRQGPCRAEARRYKNDVALPSGQRVLVAYRQLSEIRKGKGVSSARAHMISYNRILNTLNECFSIDRVFADAVSHLRALEHSEGGGFQLSCQLEADGAVLLATAHSFIELYLSPEDKKKAIGFHA